MKISIKDLSFAYGSNMVLENINVDINEKEMVTVVGPNGGGKTTFLRLIAGLLIPQKGSILINGVPPKKDYGSIGYVPQHSHLDKKFPITVFEVVLSGMVRPLGFYSKEDKQLAEEILSYVGLQNLKHRVFSNLSGGQSQRMLIARALISNAQVLLLDEPTSNIDFAGEKDLGELLKNLSKTMTIIVVTHDIHFVSEITNQVFSINKHLVKHPPHKHISEIIASSYTTKQKEKK